MMGLTCFDVIELIGELKSLKSRIAELEAQLEEHEVMNNRVAELEADNNRLKCSNDTQTDTFVYGKGSKPIPCPFCGSSNATLDYYEISGPQELGTIVVCNDCGASAKSIVDWNTRPIEDALNARIAELEAAQARWVMVSERLPNKSGWYRVGAIDVFDEGYTDEAYFGTILDFRRMNNV